MSVDYRNKVRRGETVGKVKGPFWYLLGIESRTDCTFSFHFITMFDYLNKKKF